MDKSRIYANNAVINTTNRDMAATAASFWGASATLRQDEVEQVMPAPLRQKKVAHMRTFPTTEAGSSGASGIQVHLLVSLHCWC
jgi:hypothetical protein